MGVGLGWVGNNLDRYQSTLLDMFAILQEYLVLSPVIGVVSRILPQDWLVLTLLVGMVLVSVLALV